MAKIVYVCARNAAHIPLLKKKVNSITQRLIPDNIKDAAYKVKAYGNIVYGISTYSKTIAEEDGSVCMGVAYPSDNEWWQPLTTPPDGSYAIFRCNNEYVEAITDCTASRSIWYYKDENIFVAGTSQRAVIAIAGKFILNKKVLPWILSAGMPGHYNSWSKNIKAVQANSSVLLNRHTWVLTTNTSEIVFKQNYTSDAEALNNLQKTVFNSFKNINTDYSRWILPLSGGYDSRAIACILKSAGKDISKLDTVTWGTRGSQFQKDSDGYLGGEVAKSLGLAHHFYETDDSRAVIEETFERFIFCSEGRTDHIAGYTDGLAIWKDIFNSGRQGIIRGDETLGAPAVTSYLRGRLWNDMKLCSDYSNLQDYESYGFEKQEIPEAYKPLPGETPGTYRDRMYHTFRVPNILPALSDVKLCYTEILNPILSRNIVMYSRTLPDHLRSERILFKQMVDEISPDIKYATKKATASCEDIFSQPGAVALMKSELSLAYMKDIFPEAYIKKIIGKLEQPPVQKNETFSKLKISLQKRMPVFLKELLRKNLPKQTMDNYRLAFRMYMAGKMYKLINEDIQQVNKLELLQTETA